MHLTTSIYGIVFLGGKETDEQSHLKDDMIFQLKQKGSEMPTIQQQIEDQKDEKEELSSKSSRTYDEDEGT